MTGLLSMVKSWFPPVSDESRITGFFQTAWTLENENILLYDELIPLIRYQFLQDLATQLKVAQEGNCVQIDVELASNQVSKPEPVTFQYDRKLPTDYHRRMYLLNRLLENNKSLAAIYLHLSYADTIALNSHYEKLKGEKEQQIRELQEISIRLN